MKNLVLFDTETELIRDYPRADDEPVVGLDPRYEVLRIVRDEQPEYDPATQRIRETRTVVRDAGEWRWGWSLEDLPPVPPAADWGTFKAALLQHPAINALLGSGISNAPAAVISLPPTLLAAASGGSVDDFRATWLSLRRLGLVPADLLKEVRALAISSHLPESFLAALGGGEQPPALMLGQEWLDSAGDLWRVVQVRGENGQFVADDLATPIRESLMWEKV